MEKIYLLIMLFGGLMVCRALYLIGLQIYIYRSYNCIERIAKQQDTCDKSILMCFVFMALLWIWLECLYVFSYFKVDINMQVFNTIAIGVLGLTFIVFTTIKKYLMSKYEVNSSYNNLLEYRSKLEVYTEDNDYEVNFIKTYQEVKRYFRRITLYMLGALALYLFVL